MTMTHQGLAKLGEEIGELQVELGKLQQVIGKYYAYPGGEGHPDGLGPMRMRLEDEMADVLAAIYFVRNTMNLNRNRITDRQILKEKLFAEWDAPGR